MTPPEEWSTEALALLDGLWRLNTTMLIVQRRLCPLLGFYPSAIQVMAMVKRPRAAVAEIIPPPRTVFEKVLTKRIERFGFALPIKPENPVRLVAPGTHKANAFSMLRGKP